MQSDILLGATFPEIKAVVGYVPSSVIWQGLGETRDQQMRLASSWSYHGKSLPFVPYLPPQSTPIAPKPSPNNAISLTTMYLASLNDKTAVERATIPVEKINGPVLLVSARDDRSWPSAYFSEMIMDRLARCKHPYPDQHLTYAGAGHLINFPYLPATATKGLHSTSGLILEYGGNPKANAHADRDSWTNVLKFLDQTL